MTHIDEKVIETLRILIEYTDKYPSYLSFSGGKDSTVLKHIIDTNNIDIPSVFCNTTNEDKDVLAFVKTFKDVVWITPKISFTEVLKKYGFPLVSKETSQKIHEIKHTKSDKLRNKRLYGDAKGNGKVAEKWKWISEETFNVTDRCCYHLKKAPFIKYEKETGRRPIVALMASESSLRKQLSLRDDINIKKCYPMMHWNDEDVWYYTKYYNVTIASCYYDNEEQGLKAEERTGCIGCGFGVHLEDNDRFNNQLIKNKKRMEKLFSTENNGISYIDAINKVKENK